MSYERCQNTEVSKTMAQQVASRHRDPTAKIQCCSKNGCNWNFTTASTKDGGASIDSGFTEIVADNNTLLSALGFVVLGLILLLLIFFLCFLLYKRQTKEEDPTETKEERTLFKDEGSQAANLKGMYSQKYAQQYIEMDRASSKNSFGGQYPVSSGSTKISVRPATPDTMADVWKNKSNEKYNKYDLAGHK
ncbi:uncharacterized protein LOC111717065 [Eurytemora carolleeae]|uniref:uncharacterized protein LOC111717065 n=1 Tax=Eurytemora carolleeae TaxID=1294199 RepID=UPI000C78B66F|nr:uncharacterized protein LOC111717065 [Eurytemora carolleeae]|eukprot:XP_023348349.1 uncharacterized protein LOC111717065 [Eurytemora affinis]